MFENQMPVAPVDMLLAGAPAGGGLSDWQHDLRDSKA